MHLASRMESQGTLCIHVVLAQISMAYEIYHVDQGISLRKWFNSINGYLYRQDVYGHHIDR